MSTTQGAKRAGASAQETRLNEPFDAIYKEMKLPVEYKKESMAELADAHKQSKEQLKRCWSEFIRYTREAVCASVEIVVDDFNRGEADQLRKECEAAMVKKLPQIEFAPRDILTWEVMQMSHCAALRFVRRGFNNQKEEMLRSCCEVLMDLAEQQVFGGIEWVDRKPKKCRYSFFRMQIKKKAISSSVDSRRVQQRSADHVRTYNKVTQTVKQKQTTKWMKHIHCVEPAESTVSPAENVKAPRWARSLIRAAPTWLAPYMQIAHGPLVIEEIGEKVIGEKYTTDTSQLRYDLMDVVRIQRQMSPALCIGDIVLVGWSDRDVRNDPPGFFSSVFL